MGWSELEGIANRTDFDLSAHSRGPNNPDAVGELRYFDQEQKKHIVPYVIEPSAGADRATLAFLCDAYDESLVKEPPEAEVAKLREAVESFVQSVEKRDKLEPAIKQRLVEAGQGIIAGLPGTLPQLLGLSDDADANRIEVFKKVRGMSDKLGDEFTRTVLRLHPRLAPIKVAVFPLKKNEPRLVEMARAIKRELQAAGVRAVYDDTGRHREALPPPGRDRHPVLHHRRLPEPGGRHGDGARPRHAWARSAPSTASCRARCARKSADGRLTVG